MHCLCMGCTVHSFHCKRIFVRKINAWMMHSFLKWWLSNADKFSSMHFPPPISNTWPMHNMHAMHSPWFQCMANAWKMALIHALAMHWWTRHSPCLENGPNQCIHDPYALPSHVFLWALWYIGLQQFEPLPVMVRFQCLVNCRFYLSIYPYIYCFKVTLQYWSVLPISLTTLC